jgi:hypothetical protein
MASSGKEPDMTASWMFRSLAVALFAVCVGLITLPGCGKPAPTNAEKKNDKKEEPKTNPNPQPDPNTKPNTDPKTNPPPNTLGEVEKAADQAATAFLTDLVQGKAKSEALSAAFVKAVGKPWLFDSDKARGYSADSATSWLKRVGDGVNIGLALKRQQAGEVVYMRGVMSAIRLGKDPTKTGSYLLRLVKENGAWKVDWLSFSSADITVVPAPPSVEGVAQEFAILAFVETVADLNGLPQDDRPLLIAAAMTSELRKKWAPPFEQDMREGFIDFNPKKLGVEATKLGGGTSTGTISLATNTPEFLVTLTKPAGKKTYSVKLTKGDRPNEWLVSEVAEKG